jgi:hypothetical protein
MSIDKKSITDYLVDFAIFIFAIIACIVMPVLLGALLYLVYHVIIGLING